MKLLIFPSILIFHKHHRTHTLTCTDLGTQGRPRRASQQPSLRRSNRPRRSLQTAPGQEEEFRPPCYSCNNIIHHIRLSASGCLWLLVPQEWRQTTQACSGGRSFPSVYTYTSGWKSLRKKTSQALLTISRCICYLGFYGIGGFICCWCINREATGEDRDLRARFGF